MPFSSQVCVEATRSTRRIGRQSAVSALLFLGGFVLAGYLWKLSRKFPEAPFKQPSRLYASAPTL